MIFSEEYYNLTTYLTLRELCMTGYTNSVGEILEQRKPNIHYNDDKCLRMAVLNNHTDIVKILLEYGANVHCDKDSPIIRASENGFDEIVSILINYGADINAENGSPIIEASRNGHFGTVKLLLEANCNIPPKSLEWASYNKHQDIVKLLLDHGADESNLHKCKCILL